MESDVIDGYFNFQKSKLKQIKDIFSQLTFKDKTIKNRIDELWLGLELKANFADSKKPYFVNGAPVYLKRGQLAICKKTYAEDRKISISVFNRVLSVLEENGLIVQKNIIGVRGHSIITILNYGDSKKISKLSENSKSGLNNFIGPLLPCSKNPIDMGSTEQIDSAKNTIKNLKNFNTPQPKELLNIRTKKIIINKTTTATGDSSSLKNILEKFKEKLPKSIIHLDKFKNQLQHSNLAEIEILERIDIISKSPVLTDLCKSINFVFTLENKHSFGYKREKEYLYYRKNEIDFLKTNAELEEKLDDMADYLNCSREILDQYLISKGFDLNKPDEIEEFEDVEVVEEPFTKHKKNSESTGICLDFETFNVKKETPKKSESPVDSNLKIVKQNSTRKKMEKTLLDLATEVPEKRAKVESFFHLLNLTGKVNPALQTSFDLLVAQ